MSIYKARPVSRKDIRNLVHKLKCFLGIENECYCDVIRLLENILPQIDEKFEYCIVENSCLPYNVYAQYIPEEHLMEIAEDVYDGACADNPRDRFTIAHEIGHAIMHSSRNIKLCRINEYCKVKTYEDPEWQANAFAGYLLMSPNSIFGMTDLEISEKCKVSLEAAKIQLKCI